MDLAHCPRTLAAYCGSVLNLMISASAAARADAVRCSVLIAVIDLDAPEVFFFFPGKDAGPGDFLLRSSFV